MVVCQSLQAGVAVDQCPCVDLFICRWRDMFQAQGGRVGRWFWEAIQRVRSCVSLKETMKYSTVK